MENMSFIRIRLWSYDLTGEIEMRILLLLNFLSRLPQVQKSAYFNHKSITSCSVTCKWDYRKQINSIVLWYYSFWHMNEQISAVADEPGRRAASRQTSEFKNGHVTITTPI